MVSVDGSIEIAQILWTNAREAPPALLVLFFFTTVFSLLSFIYFSLFILAPTPRGAAPPEREYITSSPSGQPTSPLPLPCWHATWIENRKKNDKAGDFSDKDIGDIEAAEVIMSVVIPAYNEEERLEIMLEEAIEYLDAEYGRPKKINDKENGKATEGLRSRGKAATTSGPSGYEILLVDDGSKDKTVEVALKIAQKHALHDILRVVSLVENRGKGGAVTHGFKHVRGEYAIFADADGASKFSDLGKLVEGCEQVHDGFNRGVAVGSRAHMVNSEAVVKRSALRNTLMHGFHLLLRLLTPPATSQIKDTQCGFKLFSRASLPYIIPYMHAEGWIFDVEMLMLAESAPVVEGGKKGPGIRVAEVPIGWKEIGGSKLNVMWDSLGMAWGLAILRLSWAFGVYRR